MSRYRQRHCICTHEAAAQLRNRKPCAPPLSRLLPFQCSTLQHIYPCECLMDVYTQLHSGALLPAAACLCVLQSLPNNWRWMVGSPLLPALLLGAAPLVLPESPRWLVMRGNLPAALAALHEVKYSQVCSPDTTQACPVSAYLYSRYMFQEVPGLFSMWNGINSAAAGGHTPARGMTVAAC